MVELDVVKQRPIRPDMERLPSIKELYNAVGKLRNGTATGESVILPEMVSRSLMMFGGRVVFLVIGVTLC